MSRIERKTEDGRYTIVFGVDHVTSSFVMVYDHKLTDDLQVVFCADNTGVIFNDEALTSEQNIFAENMNKRFDIARQSGISFPNLAASDIVEVAEVFNFIDKNNDICGPLVSEIYFAIN